MHIPCDSGGLKKFYCLSCTDSTVSVPFSLRKPFFLETWTYFNSRTAVQLVARLEGAKGACTNSRRNANSSPESYNSTSISAIPLCYNLNDKYNYQWRKHEQKAKQLMVYIHPGFGWRRYIISTFLHLKSPSMLTLNTIPARGTSSRNQKANFTQHLFLALFRNALRSFYWGEGQYTQYRRRL